MPAELAPARVTCSSVPKAGVLPADSDDKVEADAGANL